MGYFYTGNWVAKVFFTRPAGRPAGGLGCGVGVFFTKKMSLPAGKKGLLVVKKNRESIWRM